MANDHDLKKIIDKNVYDLIIDLVQDEEPFSLLLANYNDWDHPLPERLRDQKAFILYISDDTLEDSFVNNDGQLVIVTDFDGTLCEKILLHHDVMGVYNLKNKPLLVKEYFSEYVAPFVKVTKKFKTPSDQEIQPSMEMFRKLNPHLFK